MLEAMRAPTAAATLASARALHVGYPHLLQGLRGEALRELLDTGGEAIRAANGGVPPLLSVDVNGATLGAAGDADGVLGPALPLVDVLHANFEEACHLSGGDDETLDEATATDEQLHALAAPLLERGVAVVAITLGPSGAYVALTSDRERLVARGATLRAATVGWEAGAWARLPAPPVGVEINANGAGDAFTAGILAAMLWRPADANAEPPCLEEALRVGLASARQRVDATAPRQTVAELVGGHPGP